MKNQGLFASVSHNQSAEKTFQLLEKGANSITRACAFAAAATGTRWVRPLYSLNQWRQRASDFWGHSRESLMENKVEAKKPPSREEGGGRIEAHLR